MKKLYELLNVQQNTPEWKARRLQHCTASQAPVLFDLSPYQTRLQLFEEKVLGLELTPTQSEEILFARGHKAEEIGREWIKKNLNLNIEPAVVVSTMIPDLLASLDGFEPDKGIIFEAKYMGKDNLEKVKKGSVQPHHECQVQAQLLATGAEKCIYFGMDGSSSAMLEILPDKKFQESIAQEIKAFMDCVREGVAPKPGERDFIDLNDPRLDLLRQAKLAAEKAEENYDKLRKEVIDAYKDIPRFRGYGIQVMRIFKKGNVDYSAIPQLKGVDLDKFRKAARTEFQVKLEKVAKEKRGAS